MDMTWLDKSACRRADAQLFFGPEHEGWQERELREAAAVAVCQQCPVRAQCLNYALSYSIGHGIWGGLNDRERARSRRHRRRHTRTTRAA